MKPSVSVILAAYNHENFIERTVHSVLNQTYKDFEFIIIDDKSNDKTPSILKSIKDERIKLECSDTNRGTVSTFNRLLKKCRGEYIAILGSDDLWYPEKLEKQIAYLNENRDCHACFSWCDIIDESDEIYKDGEDVILDIFNQTNRTKEQWVRLFFESGNHLCHPSSVITKELLENVGQFNLAFRQLHDYDYWIRCLPYTNFHIIEENLLGYRRVRVNNNSVSSGDVVNIIRTTYEDQIIMSSLFERLDEKMFLAAFKDKVHDVKTKQDIIACKFLVLLSWKKEKNNKQVALDYIMHHIHEDGVLDALKERGYSLNDVYSLSGKLQERLPWQHNDSYKELSNQLESYKAEYKKVSEDNKRLGNELNEIFNSTSWKITKPLRKLIEKIRGS